MAQQIQVVASFIQCLPRYYRGLLFRDGRIEIDNNRGFDEIVDDRAELSDVQNKRRKVVEELPCFNSAKLNRVVEWLKDDKIATIGVYGMGGVGKTTFATQIYTWLKNRDIRFDGVKVHAVSWVSVGVDFSVYQLQQKIVDAFGFDLQGDRDRTTRAGLINGFLCRKGKSVLFVDGLWDDFRREDVGIPRECKVVVVCRSLDVCYRLYCQRVVKVEPLSEDESWQLFDHSIGGCGVSDIRQVLRMKKVLFDKCAGLPLAIIGVADSLRAIVDGNASRWREVVESMDLFIAAPKHLKDTLDQLKLSYQRLKDVKLQRCFLCAALYPKDYAISKEELIRLWIGMKLIGDASSLQAQYNMGHSILNKLLNSCLLEACEDERRIKIHDLVRRMALSIAGDSYMVEAGMPRKQLELHKNLQVVSLINSSISMIPSVSPLMCHCLSTLLLQHNPLESIPESFFSNMLALRVLNLSHTRLSRLPKSIGELEELRVLDVSFCENLKQVPSLSKLLKLQILDLSQTAIQVPRSLDLLRKIIELNLSSISGPNKFPSGVLPALFRLKRLTCQVGVDTIDDLQQVSTLEILDARFINLGDLRSYVRSRHWGSIESYHLQVGCELGSDQLYSRRVTLQGRSLTDEGVDNIVIPSNIQELYVDNCRDFCSLSDVLYPVLYCPKNCQDQQVEAFPSLETCIISRCHDIETLFSPSWVENLQSLELLRVEDCQGLKGIIAQEAVGCVNSKRDYYSRLSLPQLKRLILNRLPRLTSIYKGQLVCASLLSCTFMDCPELKRLPFSSMAGEQVKSFPYRLESIEGEEKWWDLLEWDQPECKSLLKPLFRRKSSDVK